MKQMLAWSPIGYEGQAQILSAIWISPTQPMPLDHDFHRAMVGDRIDRIFAQFDDPDEAVAEAVESLYTMGVWPEVCTVPVDEAGRTLVWSNLGVGHYFGAWGISEALPVFQVFEMPNVRDLLEWELDDPYGALERWLSALEGWTSDPGPNADETATQRAHLMRCGRPT